MHVEGVMVKDPVCCRPEEPLRDAARQMAEHGASCLVVVADAVSRRVVGMLTEGDVCRAAAEGELGVRSVASAMSSPVLCRPRDLLWEVLLLGETHGARRFPVVEEGGQLLGLITLEDVAREAAREQPGVPALSPHDVCRVIAESASKRQRARAADAPG